MKKRFIFTALVAILAFAMIGCPTDGGGDDNNTPVVPPATPTVTSVTVTPASPNVPFSGTQQFSAAVAGTNSPAQTVTWTIEGTPTATGSTVSATGLFTAGTTAGTATVRATSTVDTTKFGETTVTVFDETSKKNVRFYWESTTTPPTTLQELDTLLASPDHSELVDVGNAVADFPEDPSKLGFTFEGWMGAPASVFEDLTDLDELESVDWEDITDATTFSDDYIVFAVWEEEEVIPGEEGVKVTFYNWNGGAVVATITLEEGVTFEDADEALPVVTRQGYVFNRWIQFDTDGTTEIAVTAGSSFWVNTNVYGTWYSTTLAPDTTDTGVEKVYLHNGSYVIYEFDMTGKNIADIDKITVQYKASEATINTATIRNQRLMGPYVYRDYISHVDNDGRDGRNNIPYFGDFVMDRNGAYIAKYISGGNALDYASDKNGPYINYSKTSSWTGDWSVVNAAGTKPEPNTWFDAEYPFSLTSFNGVPETIPPLPDAPGNGYTLWKLATQSNAPTALNTVTGTTDSKIYFGIGLPSAGDDKGGNHLGNTHLVKNVQLVFTDTTTVDGAVPSFATQVFAAYIDPINFNWRGAADADIAYPTTPSSPAPGYPDLTGIDLGDYDDDTGEGYFFANLPNSETVFTGSTKPTTSFAGSIVTGTLTADFSGTAEERLVIGLLPAHISELKKAADGGADIKVTITGEAKAADGITDSTLQFRVYVGTPFTTGQWNGAGFATNTSISDIVNTEISLAFDASNKVLDGRLYYLILRSNTTGDATKLTITSIKFEYNAAPPPPPEECDCDDNDCDGLFMITCTIPPGGVCNCTKKYTVIPNLDNIRGIQNSGGPKYGLVEDHGGLFVFGRTNNYSTIDLQLFTADDPSATWKVVVAPAKYYRVTVTGKVVMATGLQAEINQSVDPYDQWKIEPVTGTVGDIVSYSVELKTKTGAELAAGTRIRLIIGDGTAAGSNPSFVVESIELVELDASDGDDVEDAESLIPAIN